MSDNNNSGAGNFLLGALLGGAAAYFGYKYIQSRNLPKNIVRAIHEADSRRLHGLESRLESSYVNVKEEVDSKLPQYPKFREYLRKRDEILSSLDLNLTGDEIHFAAEDVYKKIEELGKEYPVESQIFIEKAGLEGTLRDFDFLARKDGYKGINDPEFNKGMEELRARRLAEPEVLEDKYGICDSGILKRAISKIDSSPDINERGKASVEYNDEIRKLKEVHPAEYTRLIRILSKHSNESYKRYNNS